MFCNMLHNNALFNDHGLKAGEFFHHSARSEQQQTISDNSTLAFIRQSLIGRAVSHKNVFQLSGFKLLQDQLLWLSSICAENSSAESFLYQHVKYIYLRRRNKTQQAISLLRARHEGRWHSADSSNSSTNSAIGEYSNQAISKAIAEIKAQEQWVERYFRASRIPPLHLYYEDIICNPSLEINKLSAHLGLPSIENPDTRTLYRKTRDSINLQLELNFNHY